MSNGKDTRSRPEDFPDTRWSIISAVQRRSENQQRADQALATVCERYWYPLYAFARRQGLTVEDAQDATQGFFAHLIEKETLKAADRERGRLRTFLLSSFRYFLADEHDRRTAWRRGGRTVTFSFDAVSAEKRFALEPRDEVTPEQFFDRQWSLTILKQALDLLEVERTQAGQAREMNILRPFLDASGISNDTAYTESAAALGWSVNATRVAVHRLRKRFRQLLQNTVAATLEDENPGAVKEEMQAMLASLAEKHR